MTQKPPLVGIATILKKDGLVLIGKRMNSHGSGTLNFPGGHLEPFESFLDYAKRELNEETGLTEKDFIYRLEEPVAITEDFFRKEKMHYLTMYLEAEQISEREPRIMEPKKLEFWKYSTWESLVKNKDDLFLPVQNLIKQEYHPFRK